MEYTKFKDIDFFIIDLIVCTTMKENNNAIQLPLLSVLTNTIKDIKKKAIKIYGDNFLIFFRYNPITKLITTIWESSFGNNINPFGLTKPSMKNKPLFGSAKVL